MLTKHSAWGLVLISRTLSECYVFDNSFDVYNFAIAYGIFFNIGQWLLLFIQVWGVNRLLSQRLGSAQAMVKIITLAITGLMGVLTVALIGLTSYNNWQRMARDGFSRLSTLEATVKLTVAYWVLYLISVIVGGALSLVLLTKMRSKSIAVRVSHSSIYLIPDPHLHYQDVMKRTIALIIFMILWVIFNLVPYAAALQEMFIGLDAEAALYYLDGFFQIFSYFAIISLCKLNFWKESATHTAYNNVGYGQPEYAPAQPPMQQYAYNGQPGQQQYYQQQQPVHNGVPAPANSNGHMA